MARGFTAPDGRDPAVRLHAVAAVEARRPRPSGCGWRSPRTRTAGAGAEFMRSSPRPWPQDRSRCRDRCFRGGADRARGACRLAGVVVVVASPWVRFPSAGPAGLRPTACPIARNSRSCRSRRAPRRQRRPGGRQCRQFGGVLRLQPQVVKARRAAGVGNGEVQARSSEHPLGVVGPLRTLGALPNRCCRNGCSARDRQR